MFQRRSKEEFVFASTIENKKEILKRFLSFFSFLSLLSLLSSLSLLSLQRNEGEGLHDKTLGVSASATTIMTLVKLLCEGFVMAELK
jgi:hypothetical protein